MSVKGRYGVRTPRWTEAEDKVLLEMVARFQPLREIGSALGRPEDGVRARCQKLGVKPRGRRNSNEGGVARKERKRERDRRRREVQKAAELARRRAEAPDLPAGAQPLSPENRERLRGLMPLHAAGREILVADLCMAFGITHPPVAIRIANILQKAGYLRIVQYGVRRVWAVKRDPDGREVEIPLPEGTRIEYRDGVRVTICPPRYVAGPTFPYGAVRGKGAGAPR